MVIYKFIIYDVIIYINLQ